MCCDKNLQDRLVQTGDDGAGSRRWGLFRTVDCQIRFRTVGLICHCNPIGKQLWENNQVRHVSRIPFLVGDMTNGVNLATGNGLPSSEVKLNPNI